jgi:glucose-1-phosphate thymidylyltransferase
MVGIILAGGYGTRLRPLTWAVSKQLLPVYDKPMIYYPLSTLMLMDIRKVLIITSPDSVGSMYKLLWRGASLGMYIEYKSQTRPVGLPDAFKIGKDFIGDDTCCLILGDNIFYGNGLIEALQAVRENMDLGCGASIFAYRVKDPQRYGVIEFGEQEQILSLTEKPKNSNSPWAIPGLYAFDNTVAQRAEALQPSERGELEILDLLKSYWREDRLCTTSLGRGMAWLDMGTPDALLQASALVQTVQERQGLMIGCLEEIAYQKGWIDKEALASRARDLEGTQYGEYLAQLSK